MSNLWVSADGSWGCNEVATFDTKNWKDKDWERLDGEPDSAKLAFAKYITRKRDKQAKKRLRNELQTMPVRTFIIEPEGGTHTFANPSCPPEDDCRYCKYQSTWR